MAYLSGRHLSDAQQFGTYTQDDVDALRAIADEHGIVDMFLTYPCSTMNRNCSFVSCFRLIIECRMIYFKCVVSVN